MRLSRKFRINVVVKRYDTVQDTNPAIFNPTPALATSTDIQVVTSNPSAQDIKFLSMGGGMQASEYIVFHTDFPLRKGSERDQTLADEVVYNGKTFTIVDITNQVQHAKYTRALGMVKNV